MSTGGYCRRPGVPTYKVRVTVVDAHPLCGAEHKVGDTFEQFGVKRDGVTGYMCPTAFAALAPFIYAMRYGATFPWGDDPDACVYCCPDKDTPVHFEVRRLKDEAEFPWG